MVSRTFNNNVVSVFDLPHELNSLSISSLPILNHKIMRSQSEFTCTWSNVFFLNINRAYREIERFDSRILRDHQLARYMNITKNRLAETEFASLLDGSWTCLLLYTLWYQEDMSIISSFLNVKLQRVPGGVAAESCSSLS